MFPCHHFSVHATFPGLQTTCLIPECVGRVVKAAQYQELGPPVNTALHRFCQHVPVAALHFCSKRDLPATGPSFSEPFPTEVVEESAKMLYQPKTQVTPGQERCSARLPEACAEPAHATTTQPPP